MKNTNAQIFVALVVILLALMTIAVYFLMTDPYGSSGGLTSSHGNGATVLSEQQGETEDANTNAALEGEVAGGFELSSAQIDALVSLGIDPDAVPSSVSAEQEACFVGVLGEERVAEIKAGAVPGNLEFLRARSCI